MRENMTERSINFSTRKGASSRKAILDSATGIIIEKGLEALSIREISRHSKLSTGLIYHYFPDKQAVIQAVWEAYIVEFARKTKTGLDAIEAPDKKIEEKIHDAFRLTPDNPTLFKVMVNFVFRSMYNRNEQDMISRQFSAMRAYMKELFVSAGFGDRAAADSAAIILSTAIGLSIQKGIDPGEDIDIDRCASMVSQMLLSCKEKAED